MLLRSTFPSLLIQEFKEGNSSDQHPGAVLLSTIYLLSLVAGFSPCFI